MGMLAQTAVIGYLFLVAVVVWVVLTVKRGQRRLARQNPGRRAFDSPLETSPEPSYARGPDDPMVRRQLNVQDRLRELSAQLDSRIGALEQLIGEADRVAARLESALAAAGSETIRSAIPDRSSEAPPPSQADALRSVGSAVAKPQAGVSDEAIVAARPASDQRYEEIYTLADYGLEPAEIAQRLGSPVGEVDLILSLRGKR